MKNTTPLLRLKNILFVLLCLPLFHGTAMAQNIGGIGAQLLMDTTGGYTMPRILSLVRNSPAWDSLKATDYIIKVDDISCKNKTIDEVVSLIRGEAGSTVSVTVADTKEGARPREYELKRVGINLGTAKDDPTIAFYISCDNEAKHLKKGGATVIKTYHSECGNFFFNFNVAAGQYHIRIITLEDNAAGPAGYSLSAKAFDSDHEANATDLGKPEVKEGTLRLEGTTSFAHDGVCVVSVSVNDDAKKCKAMYVMMYK